MKVRMEITGTAPLLMHNSRGVNPIDPLVKQIKQLTAKRKKTEDDLEAIARMEYEVSLYYAESIGPFIPGMNIEKCVVEGGRITKNGKNIERGLFITDDTPPLLYDGPRTIEGLWAVPDFRSMMAVGVGGRKVMRCRPEFREWGIECEAELDTSVISVEDLRNVVNDAGTMVGLGDFRPRYGRFIASVERL